MIAAFSDLSSCFNGCNCLADMSNWFYPCALLWLAHISCLNLLEVLHELLSFPQTCNCQTHILCCCSTVLSQPLLLVSLSSSSCYGTRAHHPGYHHSLRGRGVGGGGAQWAHAPHPPPHPLYTSTCTYANTEIIEFRYLYMDMDMYRMYMHNI